MPSTNVQPIELDGQHWVIVDGHDKRYGPYSSAGEAEAIAAKFAAVYRLFRGDWPTGRPATKERP
jgi:hypothetical protein